MITVMACIFEAKDQTIKGCQKKSDAGRFRMKMGRGLICRYLDTIHTRHRQRYPCHAVKQSHRHHRYRILVGGGDVRGANLPLSCWVGRSVLWSVVLLMVWLLQGRSILGRAGGLSRTEQSASVDATSNSSAHWQASGTGRTDTFVESWIDNLPSKL